MIIGEVIKKHRLAKDITQEEMANALNITPQAVSRWETGVTYPDIEVFLKMADYFGVSTDELFGRKTKDIDVVGRYNDKNIEALEVAGELLECYRLSYREGYWL